MPDHPVQEFDIWLRNEISLIQLDDSQFSKQVLKNSFKSDSNSLRLVDCLVLDTLRTHAGQRAGPITDTNRHRRSHGSYC